MTEFIMVGSRKIESDDEHHELLGGLMVGKNLMVHAEFKSIMTSFKPRSPSVKPPAVNP